MAQDYSQVNFRIPTKLKEDIEKAAITNNRSITAELVSRLEESFNITKTPTLNELNEFKLQMEEQAKNLMEQHKTLIEESQRHGKVLAELREFQEWKVSQKKPT